MPEDPRPPEVPGDEARAQRADSSEKPADRLSALGRFVFGKPRDLRDRRLFTQISLVPFLAWVGLGADGLSSSCYGPEEAFRTLLVVDPTTGAMSPHTYLAVPLALLTAATVAVISACYSRLIEIFPHGGGGYLVATKLLGEKAGMVAGSALIVDYVLTITVSVAAAGAALFSLLPVHFQSYRLPFEIACIVLLTVVNLRGVKESIVILMPIFLTFVVTHALLILAGIFLHTGDVASVGRELHGDFRGGLSVLGTVGMLALFLQAYSMGGGTYTGIEAVSNGLAVLRAPQVQTGKRTMLYMAASLSFTAAGLIVCYLLLHVTPTPGRTMNALLAGNILESVFPGMGGFRSILLIVILASEGALLIVGAQAGFVGGPRVMANMAMDSLLPHRFGGLSDRLTISNGIVLMGATSLAALIHTGGDIHILVLMYSINVFLTFSLAQLGMIRYWWENRGKDACWRRRLALFSVGFVFCALILIVAVYEKFSAGGWMTLVITGGLVLLCVAIKAYYSSVGRRIARISAELALVAEPNAVAPPLDPSKPTAALLVNTYGGLGIHTVLKICQMFPGYFRNFHFISVGTIDSGNFKGSEDLAALEESTVSSLRKYVQLAARLGFPAGSSHSVGTDTVTEIEKLCREVSKSYRNVVFFSGKVIFEREAWYQPLFHNQTAFAVQKRLQWAGLMMVVLPLRIFEDAASRPATPRIPSPPPPPGAPSPGISLPAGGDAPGGRSST